MRKILLTLALAGLLTLPAVASAVHGSPYVAKGIAVDAGGNYYLAQVEWTGWWTQSFKVTITDTNAEVVVDAATFRGYESWTGPVYLNTEFFAYHGWSADPAVDFDIIGYQIIQINTGLLTMWYTGHYFGYQLSLFV
ncbi:MAG TPA: hypothetical protein VGR28_15150 [Candidatus Thermoplasmatota archaeon]|jgi:hypothetical protein|nr:hypothetical protein [Candidatus Thermoplasmatota archaeon]